MTTTTTTSTGTIKVGRWTYPARTEVDANGFDHTVRNTKRDGSGEWIGVDAPASDSYVADPTDVDAVDAAPAIPGFTDEVPANADYDDLRVAYLAIFDDFAVHGWDELTDIVGGDAARTRAVAYTLRDAGLIVIEDGYKPADGPAGTLFQCFRTYDELTHDQAVALFVETFNPDAKLKARSTHGGKVGAQTKKPGRSSWAVGTPCPQGHTLREGDVYVMGSGRRQCRQCRQGYASNAPAAK